MEAKSIGWGGITVVAKIANMSSITVRSGLQDIKRGNLPTKSVRRAGGGQEENNGKDVRFVECS